MRANRLRHGLPDPHRPGPNIDRFYVVQVMPNLFGDWTVLREWGRRGSPGTVRLSSYQHRNEAETAEQRTVKRRLQHGYRDAVGRGAVPGSPAQSVACGVLVVPFRRNAGARPSGGRFDPALNALLDRCASSSHSVDWQYQCFCACRPVLSKLSGDLVEPALELG